MKHNVLLNIKKCLQEIVFITISCFIALIVYGVITLPLRSIILKMEGTVYEKPYLAAISVIITMIFCFFLLLFKKKIKNRCEKEVLDDYKEEKYIGLLDDAKKSFAKGEYITFIFVSLINIIAMVFDKADILMLWSPMFFFKTIIPNNVIAHTISILLTAFAYYLFLALYRRKIYKTWFVKNEIKY